MMAAAAIYNASICRIAYQCLLGTAVSLSKGIVKPDPRGRVFFARFFARFFAPFPAAILAAQMSGNGRPEAFSLPNAGAGDYR